MRSEISVVIPSYNSAAYLPEAIESALNQTLAPLEVIVVNDGSTDETPQILERYRGRIVAITQENRGLSGARNRGIAAAKGAPIAFLDADDIWFPEKLREQLACLARHPRAALVHSGVICWNQQTGEKFGWGGGRQEPAGFCYGGFCFRNGVHPSAPLVGRECLAKVGNFDEEIRRPTAQDYDLCFRIARRYEFAYVAEPLVLYRLHASNAHKQALAMQEDILYVLRKALHADPTLRHVVGRKAVNQRLFDLLFEIGYLHHDADRPHEARRYFLEALGHRPFDIPVWSLYLANFLPSNWVRRLREFKSSLAHVARKEGYRD